MTGTITAPRHFVHHYPHGKLSSNRRTYQVFAENSPRIRKFGKDMTSYSYTPRIRFLRRCKKAGAIPLNSVRKLVGSFQQISSAIHRHLHRKKSNPPCMPLHLSVNTQADQAGSKLLSLPPEIRDIIWTFAVASRPIALHRKGGRIAHKLLSEGGPDEVTTITPETLDQVKDAHTVGKQPDIISSGLLAVLQTCQKIYTDVIPILYKANTFVILDNEVLKHFCFLTRAQHVSSVTSLHLHFRFREELLPQGLRNWPFYSNPTIPAPWVGDTFAEVADIVARGMPNLTSLSIFVQGPLISLYCWRSIITALRSMKQRLTCLDSMTARLPRPAIYRHVLRNGYNAAHQAYDWADRLKFIVGMIQELKEHVHAIQPELQDAQSEHDMADWDTGTDAGWKIGTIYSPVRGKGGVVEVEQRHYAVPVEDEQERTRKCPRFGDVLVTEVMSAFY